MASATGNLMVRRDDARTYFVVDADTKAVLLGPFDRESYAVGVANSLAWRRGSRVLAGLYRDVAVLASKLREAQARVEQLAEECRSRTGTRREQGADHQGDDPQGTAPKSRE
jgi:hypothetical protein